LAARRAARWYLCGSPTAQRGFTSAAARSTAWGDFCGNLQERSPQRSLGELLWQSAAQPAGTSAAVRRRASTAGTAHRAAWAASCGSPTDCHNGCGSPRRSPQRSLGELVQQPAALPNGTFTAAQQRTSMAAAARRAAWAASCGSPTDCLNGCGSTWRRWYLCGSPMAERGVTSAAACSAAWGDFCGIPQGKSP
jgi:hypothetical protein